MNLPLHYWIRLSLVWATLSTLLTGTFGALPDGAELYRQHCALCHGLEGRGIPGVFPPLAGADFFDREREKSLRAPLEGLFEKITVNGQVYHTGMPPVLLRDKDLAAVFAHVFTSWGNRAPVPSVEEIKALRARTKHPTYEALAATLGGGEPPQAPEGWELVVAAELAFSPVRMAAHPDGEHIVILAQNGDIWQWKLGTQEQRVLFAKNQYLDPALGDPLSLGITIDDAHRLYVTSNQCHKKSRPVTNEVTVFRTAPWTLATPWSKPLPWLRTRYPFGLGPYNHGVSHIAQGPDGLLYINSGARTDGGEQGTQPNYDTGGENPLTACLWRVNPKDDVPVIEVYARGLRNSFGFCWDSGRRLLATENGPDAHAPEELNLIEPGNHYGFPHQYSDWTKKAYPHTPEAPAGLTVSHPFLNQGPDAGRGMATFEPHSCPGGIVWLDKDWPAPLGGSFVTTRFGSLIGKEAGFDLLQLHPDFETRTTQVHRLLFPLGRPIDVIKLSGHRLLIAEYCRGTTLAAGLGTPGRLLILRPKA